MNLSEITKAIKSIDNFDDLKVVNTALSQQWSSIQKDIQGQFAVGDKVTLTHKGRVVEGIVTKLLVKNITVETDIGIFRCSPSLLTKVSDELTTV